MKKIFYFMHVPWKWVKQRPQFLAETLTKYYEVDVFSRKIYKGSLLVKNKIASGLKIKDLAILPQLNYIPVISKINRIILNCMLRDVITHYDIVWVTHPEVYGIIEDIIPKNVQVIYDCMDNATEFPNISQSPEMREEIYKCEKRLIDKSDIIFVSSLSLKEILVERYRIDSDKSISLVNNGFSMETKTPVQALRSDITKGLEQKKFKLTYIGTISEWIDFDLIIETLERFQEAVAFFFGPLQTKMPRHKRLFHFGAIEHEYIAEIMDKSDVLIMPFLINDLTLGVDPVKLYEYIFSCKPVIAVNYPEATKFSDYVYLYSDRAQFFHILSGIISGEMGIKKDCAEYKIFAKNNSWEKRADYIYSLIH